MKNQQSQSMEVGGSIGRSGLQVVDGGRVKTKVVLNSATAESIADRFLIHGAKLSTLAWETGHNQGALCAVIVAVAKAEGIRIGRNQARFCPPMSGPEARRAA